MKNFFKSHRLILIIFCVVFAFTLSLNALLIASKKSYPVIRSDGKGYYLYLPSAFIHRDMTMKWTEPLRDDGGVGYSLSEVKDDVYLDKYTVGMAMLWAPFFWAAHIMAYLTNQPADGFSAWYQVAIGFAAATYAALGCTAVFALLRRYFSIKVAFLSMLTVMLGTNYLSYVAYDGSFTHVYSMFLIAALLYVTPMWYKRITYRATALLAALLALIVLVRLTDIMLVIPILLWGVTGIGSLQKRFVWLFGQWRKLLFGAGVGLAVMLPQFLYWKFVTGKWLVFSYTGETFDFTHPHIIEILFSTDRGVFFWAPVLLLSAAGIFLLKRYAKEWLWPICVFFPVWLFVVSSWHSWQFGVSYGHRAFIDMFPLLVLPLAAIYAACRNMYARIALGGFVVVCILANLFQMYLYWTMIWPGADTTLGQYIALWQSTVPHTLKQGLASGFLGLIGLLGLTLIPLTCYVLMRREPRQT